MIRNEQKEKEDEKRYLRGRNVPFMFFQEGKNWYGDEQGVL